MSGDLCVLCPEIMRSGIDGLLSYRRVDSWLGFSLNPLWLDKKSGPIIGAKSTGAILFTHEAEQNRPLII